MGYAFSGIGPVMFGILWDPSKSSTTLGVKLYCLIGGVIHYIGFLTGSASFMAIGYLFLSLTAVPLYSIVLASINFNFSKNKLGSFCVFWFWNMIANLIVFMIE